MQKRYFRHLTFQINFDSILEFKHIPRESLAGFVSNCFLNFTNKWLASVSVAKFAKLYIPVQSFTTCVECICFTLSSQTSHWPIQFMSVVLLHACLPYQTLERLLCLHIYAFLCLIFSSHCIMIDKERLQVLLWHLHSLWGNWFFSTVACDS